MKNKNMRLASSSHCKKYFLRWLLFALAVIFFADNESASAATYNVPSQGSLSSVCSQATSWGDVINISGGSFYSGGTCYLAPGVKVIGAGKDQTIINTSISAESDLPVRDGSNEIAGITFDGAGISSVARSNQKIHDIAMRNTNVLIRGKDPQGDWGCEGGTPSRSATFCYNFTVRSHEPEEGDWADGVEFYNNTLTDTNLKPHTIRGAKIYNNTIDNSRSGLSGVGWTSFWWNGVDFYNNKITMDEISWTHIAMEVWMISNDTKFRDNWTNGWFSLLDNPNGINAPYSWEITGNTFHGNSRRGDVSEALETSYSSANVLIANNLFENEGSYNTYRMGVAIWGTGKVSNYTVRNNIFRNMDDGVEINTGDQTTTVPFEGSNINFYNNTFDTRSTGIYISDGRGTLNGVKVKNNLFVNLNTAVMIYPGGNDVRNVEFTHNNTFNTRGSATEDSGSGAFSNVFNNYNLDPSFDVGYKLKSTSQLIDKGIDVGRPYNGSAPDIGAHEYGMDVRIGSEGSGSDPDTGGGDPPPPPPPPPPKTYGIADFTLLVANWMKRISGSPVDLNVDGIINIRDLGIMMSKWK